MTFKKIWRTDLQAQILSKKDDLKKDVVIVTSVMKCYAFKDHIAVRDLLEVEICQKRLLKDPSPIGRIANKEYTLLFDHITFASGEELLSALPDFKATKEELFEIWRKSTESGLNGPKVYVKTLFTLPSIKLEDDNEVVTPVITVIELVESKVDNYLMFTDNSTFIRNMQDFVLKINGEFVVDGSTGERIYRIPRTQFIEDNPKDIFIKNKVLESEFSERVNKANTLEKATEIFEEYKNGSYLFFDTETTGLPKNWNASVTDLDNWPRLVQLAYLFYDKNGNRITGGSFIIKPQGFQISAEVSKVHRISHYKALTEGREIKEVLQEFYGLLNKAEFLVAHNIAFDEKIMGAEFLRANYKYPFSEKKKICTMKSSTDYCAISGAFGYKYPKLSDLYFKLFRESLNEAHDASVDIEATAKCFWALRRLDKI